MSGSSDTLALSHLTPTSCRETKSLSMLCTYLSLDWLISYSINRLQSNSRKWFVSNRTSYIHVLHHRMTMIVVHAATMCHNYVTVLGRLLCDGVSISERCRKHSPDNLSLFWLNCIAIF